MRRLTPLLVLALVVAALATRPVGAQADPLSRFVAAPTPTRILDTREAGGPLGPDGTRTLAVAGAAGSPVPNEATAAVLTVTLVDAAGPGYLTVWPAGELRPLASNLNATFAGQTVANLVTVKLGAGGAVDMYAQTGGHVVVDVAGWFEEAGPTETAGRFVPAEPTWVLGTRIGEEEGRAAPGANLDVVVAGVAGVPADAVAVVVVATLHDASAPGFVTVWPTGGTRPQASNLNASAVGQTVSDLVVVPIGDGGRITVTTQSGGHLLVDLVGWFTGPSAPAASTGLFAPVSPARVLDTREGHGAPRRVVGPGGSVALTVPGASGAVAAIANVTVTDPPALGLLDLAPLPPTEPLAAFDVDEPALTLARAAVLPLDEEASTTLSTRSGGHLVADVQGWFVA